jgi:hypothetical protein
MRSITPWAAMAFLVVTSVFGQQSVVIKGRTYYGAELIQEYPQSVYVSHTEGREFFQKSILSAEAVSALGVTNPVTDAFQERLDNDLSELQQGLSRNPAPGPGSANPSSTSRPQQRALVMGPTRHAAVAVDAQRQGYRATTAPPRPNPVATKNDRRISLPDQPWMKPMDSSGARLGLFSRGFLPLKKEEAKKLFAGEELSPLSSRCALNAFKAAKVMLGDLSPDLLPREYKQLLRRSAPSTARAPAAAARSPTSGAPDSPMFPAGNAISAASAAPRFVNTHDNAGNFHTGVVQPTGFYHGTVHSPRGDVGHVTGHISPIGSFQGTDNHGGFYHGH